MLLFELADPAGQAHELLRKFREDTTIERFIRARIAVGKVLAVAHNRGSCGRADVRDALARIDTATASEARRAEPDGRDA